MWIVSLAAAISAWVGVAAATGDGRGYTWTPDGNYWQVKSPVDAQLHSDGTESTLTMGNHCILTGRLTRIAGKPLWRFLASEADGSGCPDVPGRGAVATIEILDGPGVHATGNARRIRIRHSSQKGRFSFTGIYVFRGE